MEGIISKEYNQYRKFDDNAFDNVDLKLLTLYLMINVLY